MTQLTQSPGAVRSSLVWSWGRTTSVCTVSCRMECLSCRCCSFWSSVWSLMVWAGSWSWWRQDRSGTCWNSDDNLCIVNQYWIHQINLTVLILLADPWPRGSLFGCCSAQTALDNAKCTYDSNGARNKSFSRIISWIYNQNIKIYCFFFLIHFASAGLDNGFVY